MTDDRNALLHQEDLEQIAIAAGLREIREPSQWLEERGVCAPAVYGYGDRLIAAVVEAVGGEKGGAGLVTDGVWNSGFTLGLAVGIAKRRKPTNDLNLDEMRTLLRGAHPSFETVDATLVDLAHDDRIEPDLYEAIAEAIFTVLNAYAEKLVNTNQLRAAGRLALETLKVAQRRDMTKPPINPADLRRAISTLEASLEAAS